MFELDTSQFSEVMDSVLNQFFEDEVSIVTDTAKERIKEVVRATPEDGGFGRAGWTEAWKGVGLSGAPLTSQRPGKRAIWKDGRGLTEYNAKGKYKENFDRPQGPEITFSNNTTVTTGAGQIRLQIKRLQKEVKGKRGKEAKAVRARIKEMREGVKGKRSSYPYLQQLNAGTMTAPDGTPLGKDEAGFFTDTFNKGQIEFKDYLNKNFRNHSR